MPNFTKIEKVIAHLSHPQRRLQLLPKAGEIHAYPLFFFQPCGEKPDAIAQVLSKLALLNQGMISLNFQRFLNGLKR